MPRHTHSTHLRSLDCLLCQVEVTKQGNHLGESEPVGNRAAVDHHLSELGAGDGQRSVALLLGLISRDVCLFLFNVHHLLEGDKVDTELLLQRKHEILGIVGTVEVLTLGVLAASMVTTNDHTSAAVVLANQSVLQSLAGTTDHHAVRQIFELDVVKTVGKSIVGELAGLSGHIVILSGADDRVNKNISIILGGNVQEHGSVGAVDGVARLEGDEVLRGLLGANLTRRLAYNPVTLRESQAPYAATDVVLLLLGHKVEDRGVLETGSAVHLLGLNQTVRCPLAFDLDHTTGTSLLVEELNEVTLLNVLIISVKGDGETEELALRETVAINDGVISNLIHEAGKGRETAIHKELEVASLTLVQVYLVGGAGKRALVLSHKEIDKLATVRHTLAGNTGVDTALSLKTTNETTGTLTLVEFNRDRGVSVTKALPDINVRTVSVDLLLGVRKVRLGKIHMLEVVAIANSGTNGLVSNRKATVEGVVGHVIL
eukprot:Colp12_sorted_trinity150504_noHs@30287